MTVDEDFLGISAKFFDGVINERRDERHIVHALHFRLARASAVGPGFVDSIRVNCDKPSFVREGRKSGEVFLLYARTESTVQRNHDHTRAFRGRGFRYVEHECTFAAVHRDARFLRTRVGTIAPDKRRGAGEKSDERGKIRVSFFHSIKIGDRANCVNAVLRARRNDNEYVGIGFDDGLRPRIDQPLHAQSLRNANGFGFSVRAEDQVPKRTRHAVVCPRIHEVVVEMMQTRPASIRRSPLMRVQAPMQHFVSGVRTHEARCVRQTHDKVCQSDRDGRDEQHDHDRDGDFFPRGGEVIAFGVVARVFFAERCRTPETSAMTGETMNHVLEKAPGQGSETNCAKKSGDHHG